MLLFFFIGFIFFIIPSILLIKFKRHGLNLRQSIMFTCRFPKDIFISHIKIYINMRNRDKVNAIKILFSPITQFSNIVNLYVYSCVAACAKIEAVKELICELDNKKDILKLQSILKQQGINLKIKKYKVKKVTIKENYDRVDELNNQQEFIRRVERGLLQRAF